MKLNPTDKVAILGSKGFIGKRLEKYLEGKCNLILDDPKQIDYRDFKQVQKFFFVHQPDYIINCVGRNGNILYNREFPATILEQNTQCINNILKCANTIKVNKILSLVASCAYPEQYGEDLKEKDFLNGPPSDSVIGHAYAKRHVFALSMLYYREFGLNAITACPTTVYGPGDNMNLNRTKIMMSLIIKFLQARKTNSDIILGSPNARRQFIYVEDLVQKLVDCLLVYQNCELPLNLAVEPDISIKELAEKIYKIVGGTGNIIYDTAFPAGQKRKQLNYERMVALLPESKFTPLDIGIEKTIKYAEHSLRL